MKLGWSRECWINMLGQVAVYGFVFGVIWFVAVHRVDPDFGWHYRSGEYIVAHGVPTYDIFTYTAKEFHWINHEWLGDVWLYQVQHTVGYFCLAGLFALIWTAGLALATARTRLSLLVAGLATAGWMLFLGVRGVAWSVLGVGAVLWLLEGKRPRYWLLVPIFALWANLHGGFVLGLAVVALAAVMRRSWRLAAWLVAAVAATCLNPYGPGMYVEVFRTLFDPNLKATIVEWGPLEANWDVLPFLALSVVTLVLMKRWSFRKVLSLSFTLSAIWTTRQFVFLILAMTAPIAQLWEAGIRAIRRWRPRIGIWLVVGSGLVGAMMPLAVLHWPPLSNADASISMPVASANELSAHPCSGNLFNHYSFGGYLIGRLPGARVYIDGRMPSWSGPEGRYLDRWIRVTKDMGYADSEFARYNVRCAVITKRDTVLAGHLKDEGWRVAVQERDAVLWRRD